MKLLLQVIQIGHLQHPQHKSNVPPSYRRVGWNDNSDVERPERFMLVHVPNVPLLARYMNCGSEACMFQRPPHNATILGVGLCWFVMT